MRGVFVRRKSQKKPKKHLFYGINLLSFISSAQSVEWREKQQQSLEGRGLLTHPCLAIIKSPGPKVPVRGWTLKSNKECQTDKSMLSAEISPAVSRMIAQLYCPSLGWELGLLCSSSETGTSSSRGALCPAQLSLQHHKFGWINLQRSMTDKIKADC